MAATAAALALLALAGCTEAPTPTSTPSPPTEPATRNATAPAPTYTLGQAWTYRTSGHWDSVPEITVVVAEAGPDGYLLAAAKREQLLDEVAWDRPLLGRADPQLRLLRDDGSPARLQWLQFPLEDGATWSMTEGFQVTAHAAQVPTPAGMQPGFRILGEREGFRVEAAYAPALGAMTLYQEVVDGEIAHSVELTGTGTSTSWAWVERAAEAFLVHDPHAVGPANPDAASLAPTTLEVREEDDAVLLWALAPVGASGTVTRATAAPWTFQGQGVPNYVQELVDATPGTWTLSGVAGTGGWSYIQAHALRWTGSDAPGAASRPA